MCSPTATPALAEETAPDLDALFLKTLIRVYRADDSHGAWDGKTDDDLLADFIVTKEQRKAMPIIANPDPDVLWRVELFYRAVGVAVEQQIGLMVSPMMVISNEGFGRVVLIAGRLVAFSRHVRDLHRFGFLSQEKLASEGANVVRRVLAAIEEYPEVARA